MLGLIGTIEEQRHWWGGVTYIGREYNPLLQEVQESGRNKKRYEVAEQMYTFSLGVMQIVAPHVFYQAVIDEYRRLGKSAAIPDDWYEKLSDNPKEAMNETHE